MAKVLVLDRETGEDMETITVRPPKKEVVTIGDMWSAIGRALEEKGYDLSGMDLADDMRESGMSVPKGIHYVVWADRIPRPGKRWYPGLG